MPPRLESRLTDSVGRARRPGGDAVEDHAHRQAVVAQHLDPVADLDDDAAHHREHPGALAGLGAGGGVGPQQSDGLADRLLHQLARGEEVVIEILLDDCGVRCGKAQRFGLDARRDVGELDAAATIGNVDLAHVLHQREIVVVNGE